MTDDQLYDGREQTLVKHFILRNYLLRLALIVGPWSKAINYIDCFSGPWKVRGEKYEDSSFGIALSELTKARLKLEERSIALALRCFFLEENPQAYSELESFSRTIRGVEVITKNKRLENAISDILEFHRARKAFPFVFIDPTGWTGFPLRTIRPLLQLKPGEVLINFMTWHARRFIESDQERQNFDALYGDSEWRSELAGLSADDRDDAMVRMYANRIQKAGGFDYVAYTPVLHREDDTTHFHLIYGSRNQKGLEVFKEAERGAVALMEKKRTEIQEAKNLLQGQSLLFGPEVIQSVGYYGRLRSTYLERAKKELKEKLTSQGILGYDEAWHLALKHPLVWEADLKNWLKSWEKDGLVDFGGQELRRGVEAILSWSGES